MAKHEGDAAVANFLGSTVEVTRERHLASLQRIWGHRYDVSLDDDGAPNYVLRDPDAPDTPYGDTTGRWSHLHRWSE